jgi:membrane protease YdiL (CAAX protease family)
VLWQRRLQPDLTDFQQQIPSVPAWVVPLAGLVFAVVNAAMEEAAWRWILWDLLDHAIERAWIVVLLQAGSFGLFHMHGFPRGWIGVGRATVYGLFLGTIRHRAGGLGPPIVAHLFADLTILVILLSVL